MALATRCPHCHTTFRVVQDQLKLRAGLVRCGTCKEIFNGIEHLLRPDEPALAPVTPDEHRDNPPPPDEAPGTAVEEASTAIEAEPAPRQSNSDSTLTADASDNDPLQRMTLLDFSRSEAETDDGTASDLAGDTISTDSTAENEAAAAEPDVPAPIVDAIDDLQRKPHRHPRNALHLDQVDTLDTDEPDMSDAEEPSFVKHGRRKQQFSGIMRILMAIGAVLLLIGLIAQGTYVFRNQIAAWFPQVKPALAKACLVIGCRLDLPARIEAVSIESSELQTLAASKGLFALTTLLRNHGTTAQAWPNIELTLNDANEKPLARRVFTPREYLPSAQDAAQEFGPKSEQSVKLFFALLQLKPSGYRVYLFYP